VLAVEGAMCAIRVMYWIAHTIPHQPAVVTLLIQQEDFLIEQHVCESKLYPFHVQPVKVLQHRTNITVHRFLDECYLRFCAPLNFCAVARHEGKSYATEVRVCDNLINSIQVTAADIVTRQIFSSGAQMYVNVRDMFRSREDASVSAAVIMYSAITLLTSAHHMARMY
jgi:hypothetical protein